MGGGFRNKRWEAGESPSSTASGPPSPEGGRQVGIPPKSPLKTPAEC